MLNSNVLRLGLSSLAALLVVAAPGVPSASAAPATGPSTKLINSKLPKGVTLDQANCEQTFKAFKAAAAERPDLVLGLVRAAVSDRSLKHGVFPCDCSMLVQLVDSAALIKPSKKREITELALSLAPECSDAFSDYLATGAGGSRPGGGGIAEGAEGGAVDVGDGSTGAGFGPGFPGSPGFVGSAPGGTIALPPAADVVTSVVNS